MLLFLVNEKAKFGSCQAALGEICVCSRSNVDCKVNVALKLTFIEFKFMSKFT